MPQTLTQASAEATERVHDPLHGSDYAFEREGENLWVHTWLEPGGCLPEHFHPSLDEYWEAVEGVARVKLAGSWRDLRPEDGPIHVARDVRHELRNEGSDTLYLRCEVKPGGRLEEFLTESARAAREGLYNARNLPTGIEGARWMIGFANRFSDETVVTSPPPALQRALLPRLARFAR